MFDYHNHTSVSHDGRVKIDVMIESAIEKGLSQIAITDHYDPGYVEADLDAEPDLDDYFKDLKRVEAKYADRTTVIKGIEVGLQHHVLRQVADAVDSHPFDFVIGSFHCAEGFAIHRRAYYEGRTGEEVYRGFYSYCLEVLKGYSNFDVMGHVNIIERYCPQELPPFSCYRDLIEDIFKLLIQRGNGIELNTSSIRYGMGQRCTPSREMLELYKELGGQVITIGSDAHKAQDVGRDLETGEELLKDIGFKYRTLFKDRKPEFVLL